MSQRPTRTVGKVTYPWHAFPGAYMAPVPEVAPLSPMTITDQIPAEVLRNIPADQQQAYIDQWPLMGDLDRGIVMRAYGGAPEPALGIASPAGPRTMGHATWTAAQLAYGAMAQPPVDLLARAGADAMQIIHDWPLLNPGEREMFAQAYPVTMGHAQYTQAQLAYGAMAEPPAELRLRMSAADWAEVQRSWPLLRPGEREMLVQAYPAAMTDVAQAGVLGGGVVLLALAVGAFFFLLPRK
jgi:hypothetical protein